MTAEQRERTSTPRRLSPEQEALLPVPSQLYVHVGEFVTIVVEDRTVVLTSNTIQSAVFLELTEGPLSVLAAKDIFQRFNSYWGDPYSTISLLRKVMDPQHKWRNGLIATKNGVFTLLPKAIIIEPITDVEPVPTIEAVCLSSLLLLRLQSSNDPIQDQNVYDACQNLIANAGDIELTNVNEMARQAIERMIVLQGLDPLSQHQLFLRTDPNYPAIARRIFTGPEFLLDEFDYGIMPLEKTLSSIHQSNLARASVGYGEDHRNVWTHDSGSNLRVQDNPENTVEVSADVREKMTNLAITLYRLYPDGFVDIKGLYREHPRTAKHVTEALDRGVFSSKHIRNTDGTITPIVMVSDILLTAFCGNLDFIQRSFYMNLVTEVLDSIKVRKRYSA